MIKYTAESYSGTTYNSNPYMHREGVQIVATDAETGKRRYVFKCGYKGSPCYKMGEWASHYKSGMNKVDAKKYIKTMKEAKKLAEKWNEKEKKSQGHVDAVNKLRDEWE